MAARWTSWRISDIKTRTAWVMACSKQDTPGGLSLSNNMASSWCAQDPIVAYQQLFDAICSSDFGNQLHDFRVVVPPIAANYQKRAFSTFRNG